jgi:hypothetical protein
MLRLLIEMTHKIDTFESTANDVDDLLQEVSILGPDMVLMEEGSPFAAASCLGHMLMAMPGCPVIVVSQEHNLLHVVHWQTVQVETARDLIEFINPG